MARRCKGSWLDTYIDFTSNQESPTAFHEWISLLMISAALGRHVWIPRVKYTLYPNMFCILVAESAKCKKSTSIEIGIQVLKSITNPPLIFAQKMTTEALIQALGEAQIDGASAGIIVAKELSTFLGADATKQGIIPALTDLYDSPQEWTYHTRGRGKEVLRNVSIAIIAGTTRTWLRQAIPPDSIGGGFTSRVIFIYQDRPSRPILFPTTNEGEAQMKSNLIKDLGEIRAEVKGPMGFTPEAMKAAEVWYRKEWSTMRDPKLDGYYARKHDTMFKVACLLSVAESSNRMIDKSHIDKALFMLEENEKNLGAIIASVVANTIGGDTERVLELIKRAPGGKIKHSDLLRKCWRFATAEGVNQMIRTLVESKEVSEHLTSDNRTRLYQVKIN